MKFRLGQDIVDLIRLKKTFKETTIYRTPKAIIDLITGKKGLFSLNFKLYFYNNIITHIPSYFIRRKYLVKVLGFKIKDRAFVHLGCYFYGGESPICIGEGSVIGRNAVLMGKITIGKNCSITAQSYIQTSSHKNNSPTFEGCDCELYIGDFVWMGIRAVIVPGVTHIGNGVIIGANSTVTKNIDDYQIVAGSPAKQIGIRDKEACVYELDYQPRWN